MWAERTGGNGGEMPPGELGIKITPLAVRPRIYRLKETSEILKGNVDESVSGSL